MLALRKIYETPEYSVPFNLFYSSEANLLVLNLVPSSWGAVCLYFIDEPSGALRQQLSYPHRVLEVTVNLMCSIRGQAFVPSNQRWLEDFEIDQLLRQYQGQYPEWPECVVSQYLHIADLLQMREIARIPLEHLSLGYGETLLAPSSQKLFIAFNGDEFLEGHEGLGIVDLQHYLFTRIDVGGKPQALSLTPNETLLLLSVYTLNKKDLVFFRTDSAVVSDTLSLPFSPIGIKICGGSVLLLDFFKSIHILDIATKEITDELPFPGIREFCLGRRPDELLMLIASDEAGVADRLVLYHLAQKAILAECELTEGMKLCRSRNGKIFVTTKNVDEWKLVVSEVLIADTGHSG